MSTLAEIETAVAELPSPRQLSRVQESFEKQHEIAEVLDAAEQEIALLRGQRVEIDEQKRGLMKRLLTGRVRVTLS